MAFYRCDRGLGFDTSNSTGNSSDVLYSKKFNRDVGDVQLNEYKFPSRISYSLLSNNSFRINSNIYFVNNLSIDGVKPSDIKLGINLYNINGTTKMACANYKETTPFQYISDYIPYYKSSCCISPSIGYNNYICGNNTIYQINNDDNHIIKKFNLTEIRNQINFLYHRYRSQKIESFVSSRYVPEILIYDYIHKTDDQIKTFYKNYFKSNGNINIDPDDYIINYFNNFYHQEIYSSDIGIYSECENYLMCYFLGNEIGSEMIDSIVFKNIDNGKYDAVYDYTPAGRYTRHLVYFLIKIENDEIYLYSQTLFSNEEFRYKSLLKIDNNHIYHTINNRSSMIVCERNSKTFEIIAKYSGFYDNTYYCNIIEQDNYFYYVKYAKLYKLDLDLNLISSELFDNVATLYGDDHISKNLYATRLSYSKNHINIYGFTNGFGSKSTTFNGISGTTKYLHNDETYIDIPIQTNLNTLTLANPNLLRVYVTGSIHMLEDVAWLETDDCIFMFYNKSEAPLYTVFNTDFTYGYTLDLSQYAFYDILSLNLKNNVLYISYRDSNRNRLNISRIDLYINILYFLNNYNEINITNIDSSNSNYTDYYFN